MPCGKSVAGRQPFCRFATFPLERGITLIRPIRKANCPPSPQGGRLSFERRLVHCRSDSPCGCHFAAGRRTGGGKHRPYVYNQRICPTLGDSSTKSLNAILPPAPLRMTAGGNGYTSNASDKCNGLINDVGAHPCVRPQDNATFSGGHMGPPLRI